MKKINLIEMLQGCSKRNGTAVYASNPDGQPTVNRRSRLTSYPGEMNEKEQMSSTCPRFALVLPSFCSRLDSLSLVSRQSDLDQVRAVSVGLSTRVWKHVAMIFAVLVMSMANIGMAWGVDYSSTPLVSLDFSSSLPTVSGVTYNAASYSSGKISWSGNYSKGSRDVQIAFTTTGGHFKLVIGHVTSGSSMTFKYTLDSGSAQNLTFNKSATSDTYEITASAGSHTISLGPGGSSTRTVVTSIAIYDEASSCAATANAGADKSTTVGVGVAMAATAASSGYTGAWSIKAGSPSTATSQLSSTSSATATFTPTAAGTYTLVWTVTDNSDGTCSASDEATVTVSAPVVTHDITYTNLKGADNSANPTTYTEGVGVASFANLRHAVGYDFTGWSPSSISSSATTNQTIDAQWTARAAATGTGTLTYALAFGSGTITTTSITRNNGALYDATDVSLEHTSFADNANKTGCSGKLTTTNSKDVNNYVEVTFKIADGYTFTPTEVLVQGIAVSSNKTIEVELKDNAATPNSKSVSGTLTAVSSPTTGGYTVTLDFDASGTVTLEGTVTVKIFAYGATNHWRMGTPFVITGTVAEVAAPCTAPTSPNITPSNGWLYVPGEEITLTASASNTDASTTYTWYRGATLEAAKAAGAIQAAKTAAQGGTTYTIASCTASDAYKYWCEISNGTGCEASASYDIKLYTFFLYNNDNSNNSSHAFTSIDRTNKKLSVTFDVSNATYTYYFKVSDGLGTWYGKNSSTITSATNYCDGLNSSGANVGLTTTLAGSYTVDYYYESNNVVVTYPVPNQTAGQTVYFDNTLTQMSNMYIRIGSTSYSSASSAFTAVPGTAALYQGSTIAWDGFAAWSIADNTGWTGENSIYQPWNGQWTGTGNDYQMSKQTDYQNYAVSGAVTIVPTALHNSEYNCQYYNVDKYNGLLTHNVSITPPSYGTLTVNYITISNEPAAFNSGNRDLAHTANYCVTAEEGVGYTVASITINGTPVENRSWHVLREDVVVAATFIPASYTVTLNTNGGTINAGNVTSYTYGTGATLPTNVTKDGFTFGGWYDNSGLTGSAVTTISTTATGNKEYWAKWTEAASLTALECNTRYTVQDMTAGGCGTLSGTSCYSAGLSANNRFEVLGDPSKTDQAGGTPEQKTNSKQTINSIDFTSFMYLKGDGLNGSTEPTCRGVKFIIPSAGKLTIYYRYGDRSKLKKEGEDAVNVGTTTGGYGYDTHDVTAGTYYIYGASSGAVLIAVEYQCCTTPAAPTAFAAGSITSTGATFSITDGGDAASYDIYYSTSSTAPTASTAATTTSTSKTKAVTGLTASTTYYAWVRSVCDADHKSAWVALGTTSFTTAAAEPTALVTWQMKVDQAAWALKSGTTEDGTNITSIASTADEPGSTSTGITGTTGKVVMASGESNVDKAASFTFTVNSAKKVVPEKVTCKVLNVSSGNRTYKAQLSDNNGHVYYSTNTVSVTTENVLTDATFNFASSLVLTGNVTLKVYAWKTSGSPTQFRMGEYVKLFGEVDDYSCTALNLTRGGQENGTYTVGNYTGNPLTCTVNAGEPASYQWKQYTLGQGQGEAVNAVGSGSTTTSFTPNPASANTYYYACEVTDICGNTLITPYTGTFVFNTAVTYSVTHSLTNVTATSGATGAGAATEGVAYNAVFAANTGYVLPSTITVTIGGSPATVGTGYTWNASTGAFQVPAAQVTGAIVITIAGETAPATKDIYYGHVKITDGALVREIPSGATQFFTNIGGTVANNTEISLSSTPSTGGIYYNSNNLTDAELSKSSNWGTSSGSNRYVRGLKFANGTTYTLALGTKVASVITFYGWCGSSSKVMTIGGETFTSSATKNTFAKHEFIKTGGFTGNVSITQDGDFYGILVITIQTATPCTTPVIPALSNQTVCPGSDIAAWDATQTAVLADGETASYSWKKKGNDTEIEDEATLDLGAATESMAGTYVVTVTVSKAGKASSSASKEVTLTVTAAVEEPVITANKATVYPGNSVTLTATCGTDGVTWNWYLCANADGTGAGSSLGTSSSYTIASAGAAGTYYYKAVATGSCGTAERVYTLTVTAASECEKYFWFVYAADATTNGVVNNRDGFFTGAPTGSSNSSTYKFTLDGTEYTATKNTGSGSFSMSFTIPEGSTATMGINCKGSSSKPLYLTHSSGTPQKLVSNSSSYGSFTIEDIEEGTWTLTSAGSWVLCGMAVQVCTASTCTDATPTITAANTTVCVGSELSISSTGYETGATFQWQKLNSSTSTWDNISSGATSATYTVATAAAEHAGSYRLVATKGCARTSNTVTISVPSAPNFGSTVPASVSVMQTIALSINTVEATDAVKYRWYKSADPTWDAGDTEIGTNKELIKAYDGETAGSTYYVFCRAQNACGITTSSAIAVNVTTYIEEDCATKGNEGEAQFEFENTSCSQGTYSSESAWYTNSRTKYLTYTAPEGKYFDEAKVRIAVSSGSKCGYAYSTDGGANWTYAEKTGLSSDLADVTIDLTGNVNAFRIGRNLQDGSSKDWGVTSGNFYLTKACFTYINACTATTVTPSESSVNYEMGNAWSNPTFTLSVAGTLTYSSSNEDIASVDDDGTVTFNGEAGTVTITASYAGGTISATEYCASSGSYTINVSCPGGAPKIVAAGSVDMSGCNSSVTLHAKKQDGTAFDDGTYQWFRNGEEIDGATSSSYTATQAGTYTVARTNTSGCTTPSTNSAVVTSETTEPEVERLVPFQYYHVDKTYTDQMKMRHLFAVKNSGKLDGKSFKMYVSRNGDAATDVTSSNALVVWPNGDGHVDTVMVDLNKLSGKYSENDELVFTCKAIDCNGNISDVYKNTITMNVIGTTPTLALICSGSNKASGTRKTSELTVGGDFLTGYNKADLCQQTDNTSFDANTEWGLYTRLKENYIVTPVNGYAVFNKLNYEPFDILLLTDYPKASKSDAAATVLDDMADLVDFRPMLSLKAHMVSKTPSKWAAKGFTTSPVHVTGGDGRIYMNIVCYAHPMFDGIKEAGDNIFRDHSDNSQIVYEVLTGPGYENNKGLQGFEIEAAENFVTIGLIHYNATAKENSPSTGELTWTGGKDKNNKPNDRMLVAAVERQTNLEARLIVLAVNCGAQSKFTETGRTIVHKCLSYLLSDATDPITPVADCSFTFDNGAGALHEAEWYQDPAHCPGCTGTLGDHKWSTAANWGPDRVSIPGEFTSVRIAAPVTVDMEHAHAMEARIVEGGSIEIPAGKALEVKSTIRRFDGSEISPTEVSDIFIGSTAAGNGTLIFNNDKGDSKATVAMYTTAVADVANMNAATSTWQYIGTPHNDVTVARYNYYNSWLYQYDTGTEGWTVIPNGGPLVPFRGYCVTHPEANHTFVMDGKLTATTNADIAIPANKYVVVANSWVAPIDISTITSDDMENITEKTIYFFNTGTDAEGDNGTGTAAGTYRATPINATPYTGDWQIPSMQGFYVVGGASDGTLHLDYSRHVRPAGSRTIVSNPMYAPRRAAAESDEPNVLKIFARGSRYQDKLVVLEREDFTRGYDSGWDGEAWGGSNLSPMVYVTGEGREDAVSAIPEFEGTVVAFKAGEDSEYRFEFNYSEDAEPLYLFDTENNTYTQIMTGNAYYFTTADKAPHSRFILTRQAPQVTTGCEYLNGSEGAKAKKLIIEDKMYIMLNGALYDATGKAVK